MFTCVSKVKRECTFIASHELVIGHRKVAIRSQPIWCKTKTSRGLFNQLFPRLRQFARSCSEFPLSTCDILWNFY